MENGFTYMCPKCKQEISLGMGIGFVCPNPPELEAVVRLGSFGDKAKTFMSEHPDAVLDVSLEIYRCKCGNIQNEHHIVLRAENVKSVSNRLRCNKCGSVMKMLTEAPAKLSCPKCGLDMPLAFKEEILWD